jgi:phosphoribosylanthranilate isomerase
VSAQRTRVKICGIMQADHAMAAAQAGADAIGFVFWPGTPRRVSAEHAAAIAATLPPFVSIVGLFVDPTPEHVRSTLERVPLDLLQFHGAEAPEFCRSFSRPYLKAIAVAPEAPETALLEYAGRFGDAAALLFDAPAHDGLPGGTGRTFDWDALARMRARLGRPIVLSGGLNAGNVAQAIRALRPWAVDVSSGVEQRDTAGAPRKGIKDPARIAAFIEEVRNADVRSA